MSCIVFSTQKIINIIIWDLSSVSKSSFLDLVCFNYMIYLPLTVQAFIKQSIYIFLC